jgi:flagellar hook-associated protein 3 FlgL
MYYKSLYGTNNLKINNNLFDVNKQIASGLKIQYASDDVTTFTKTMRLDNEVTTIGQIKKSTQSGYKVSNQSDIVLNEFETRMNRMRTLLLQASNGTNDATSQDAIAAELKGIKKNLQSLANTSINGEYLFSGSAVDTEPIADDGTYQGNNVSMKAFLGSNNQQAYNISGKDLFLGEEPRVKREITSNVSHSNLEGNDALTSSSKIRDLMGDFDNDTSTVNKNYFYIRGTDHNGNTFKKRIEKDDTESINSLMEDIGALYGNTGQNKVVNVSMNGSGEIVVADKRAGSSKLDFHMVGAVDFDGGTRADVTDIDDLDSGESNYLKVKDDTDGSSNHLFINEFSKSGYSSADGAASSIKGIVYDRALFEKKDSVLTSNTPQVLKAYNTSSEPYVELNKNAFATPSTKISDVADAKKEIIPSTDPKTFTLDGTELNITGKKTSDGSLFKAVINFKSVDTNGDNGSTFTINGTDYNIFNMQDPRKAVDADKMTYQQMMDVVNMVVTDNLPASNTASDYDVAIKNSNAIANTTLSYDGKIQFKDLSSSPTKAELSIADANTNDFTKDASVMTFNSNNSLTIRDPKTDFFKSIDDMIKAVESHNINPDSNSIVKRNVGIENAITKMDDLQNHVSRMHAKVGAQSNTLTNSLNRTILLETSTKTLRSSVIDTDMAEAALKLQQLTLNYQAMLSTVGKVSKLSLVNYL